MAIPTCINLCWDGRCVEDEGLWAPLALSTNASPSSQQASPEMDDEKISGIWQEEHDVGHAMDPLCKEEEQEPELHQVGQNQDESQDEVEATQGCREAKDEEKSRDELGEVKSGNRAATRPTLPIPPPFRHRWGNPLSLSSSFRQRWGSSCKSTDEADVAVQTTQRAHASVPNTPRQGSPRRLSHTPRLRSSSRPYSDQNDLPGAAQVLLFCCFSA